MSSFVRQHKGAVVLSVALHVAIVAAFTLGLRLPGRQPAPIATQLAIQAIVVDETALNEEIEKRERAERQEAQRRQREERQAREAADTARREREDAVRKEQERVAQIQLQRERAEAEERERAENAKREQERVVQERRQREEREQRERAEAERRQREAAAAAKRQAETEAELQRVIAAEATEEAALLAQYVLLIQNRIEQKWIRPLTARPGLDCVVDVVQIPGGDIVDVRVGRCNGDEATIRSIEAAVKLASPLPPPPRASLFSRNLRVFFRPDL
ncbi:MAG TPA: TonB C-terminal domain-containing protein, partial [Gammaproteobacteria bacterium]|nr:TonB C-terminal domain-containing protein [Gammaproteobacteria bacterium]